MTARPSRHRSPRCATQRAIETAAYAEQQEIEAGERTIVGLNRYTDSVVEAGLGIQGELFRLDATVADEQAAKLRALRAERDAGAVTSALRALGEAAAASDENLMPHMLNAVRAYASVGEISDTLRAVFGTHREQP